MENPCTICGEKLPTLPFDTKKGRACLACVKKENLDCRCKLCRQWAAL